MTKIDLFERSLTDMLQKGTLNNVELYGLCLEQGFCASKANELLRNLQEAHTIVVTDMVTRTPARKGSFYLTDPCKRVIIGLRKK